MSSTACGVQPGLGAPRNSSHTPAPASGACVVSLSCKRNENPWSRSPSLPRPFLEKNPQQQLLHPDGKLQLSYRGPALAVQRRLWTLQVDKWTVIQTKSNPSRGCPE